MNTSTECKFRVELNDGTEFVVVTGIGGNLSAHRAARITQHWFGGLQLRNIHVGEATALTEEQAILGTGCEFATDSIVESALKVAVDDHALRLKSHSEAISTLEAESGGHRARLDGAYQNSQLLGSQLEALEARVILLENRPNNDV